jgi:putative heme-binding domain-containing protein
VRSGNPPATSRGQRWLTPLLAAIGMWLLGQSAASAQSDHHYRAEDVQNGYTLYQLRCQLCHGPNGDMIGGVNLARQRFRHAVSDDDIHATILNGSQGGMPAFDLSNGQVESLTAYIRSGFDIGSGPVQLGNAANGRRVYDAQGCASCHRIAGQGSRVAPDLGDIGLARQASVIRRSLLEPDSVTQPINRTIQLTLKDGRVLTGRRLNEDTLSVQFIDSHEALQSIARSDIANYTVLPHAGMPSYAGKLSDSDLADLVAFLANQRAS